MEIVRPRLMQLAPFLTILSEKNRLFQPNGLCHMVARLEDKALLDSNPSAEVGG
jgi:hypothetical protein